MAATSDISENIKVTVFAVLGIVIFGVHMGLYYINPILFNIMVSLYVCLYSILVLMSSLKNKDCMQKGTYGILVNTSLYTVTLQICLIIFAIVLLLIPKKKHGA